MKNRLTAFVLACSLTVISCAPATTVATLPAPSDPASALASPTPAVPAAVATSDDPGVDALPADTESGMIDHIQAIYVSLAASAATGSKLTTFTGPLPSWPVTGRNTSPFGPRWGGFHNGLDIASAMYTPIRAAAPGLVVTVGKPTLVYGDTATIVIIAHGGNFSTLYAHLNDERPPVVKVGQTVAAGQVIAYNGSTGWSTGPHVHFMTIVNGRAVNPLQYLP